MDIKTKAREVSPRKQGAERLLRFALWVTLIDVIGFGGLIFFVPSLVVETLGGLPGFAYFSLRWSGGLLLGLAVGVISMLRNPRGQLPLFTACAVGTLLAGFGKVWSGLAGEYGGATWWYVATLIGTLGVSALLWAARVRAKELLE